MTAATKQSRMMLSPAEAARLEVYLTNTDPALADGIVGMLSDKVQVRALPKPPALPDLAGRICAMCSRPWATVAD